jgi:hypothetical protein
MEVLLDFRPARVHYSFAVHSIIPAVLGTIGIPGDVRHIDRLKYVIWFLRKMLMSLAMTQTMTLEDLVVNAALSILLELIG